MGNWAKEQITIENISSNPDIEIFSYMDIRNPGIISQVKGYQIRSLYDISGIVNFALEKKIDLVIITTAPPLSIGLVDALEENHILAFGPVRLAARLEAVDLDERSLRKIVGLRYYYSCGLDGTGKLNVGTERGIAFVARAHTIEEANEKVEKIANANRLRGSG